MSLCFRLHCIDIVDFIDWLDVGHLRSADEKCFSEANVAGMLKDFAITNPAIPATVTRCKDCRYGLPCKLFGHDAITCTKHREEIHPMDWYCADAAKTGGKDDAKWSIIQSERQMKPMEKMCYDMGYAKGKEDAVAHYQIERYDDGQGQCPLCKTDIPFQVVNDKWEFEPYCPPTAA